MAVANLDVSGGKANTCLVADKLSLVWLDLVWWIRRGCGIISLNAWWTLSNEACI